MITLAKSAKRKGRWCNSKIRRCINTLNSKNPLLDDIPFIKVKGSSKGSILDKVGGE